MLTGQTDTRWNKCTKYKSVGYAKPPFQVSDRSYGVQCIQEIFTYSKESNKHWF
jgi:hypothetical protein